MRRFWIAVLVAAVVGFLRAPSQYLLPTLFAEDGRELFAFYYNHPEPSAILHEYSGYVSLLCNLVGRLALALPVQVAPYALVGFALFAQSLASAVITLPPFRRLIPSDDARFVCALVLGTLPLASLAEGLSTMYAQWSLLAILSLFALVDPPEGSPARVAVGWLWRALIGCTNPTAMVLGPLYLTRAVLERGRARLFFGSLLASLVGYQLVFVHPTTTNVFERNPLQAALSAGHLLAGRVLLESLIGSKVRAAVAHQRLLVLLAALALLAALWMLTDRARLDPARRRSLLAAAYLMVALTGAVTFARGAWCDLDQNAHARYFVVQKVLFLVSLFSLATTLPAVRLVRPGLAALGLYVVVLSYVEAEQYRGWRDGPEVRAFVARVSSVERAHGGRRNIHETLDRGGWSVVLDRP